MVKLSQIIDFNPQFWKKIGDEITDEIRVQTQKRSKNVDGTPFKEYSTGYRNRKPRIRRGSGSNKVNLTLTGDMMNGLQTRSFNKESVTIGWSGVNAKKVQWNEDMGRVVTSRDMPLSKQSLNIIETMTGKKIKLDARKVTQKPITFRLGKK